MKTLQKYVNQHFFSIAVGAGAARRRRFVYNAECGCRTGTTQHRTAQPSTILRLYK